MQFVALRSISVSMIVCIVAYMVVIDQDGNMLFSNIG